MPRGRYLKADRRYLLELRAHPTVNGEGEFGPDRTVHHIGGTPPLAASAGLSRAEILKLAGDAFEAKIAPYAYFASLMAHAARALRYQADDVAPEHARAGRAMARLIETGLRESGLQPNGHVAPNRGSEPFDPVVAAERIVTDIRK